MGGSLTTFLQRPLAVLQPPLTKATALKTSPVCATYRLLAPRAADGDDLLAVEGELLLEALLATRR